MPNPTQHELYTLWMIYNVLVFEKPTPRRHLAGETCYLDDLINIMA